MANKCTGCVYWRRIDGVNSFSCNYILDTGHRRGCSSDKCDKYIPASAQPQEHGIYIGTLSPEAIKRKQADDDIAGYEARQARRNRRYINER